MEFSGGILRSGWKTGRMSRRDLRVAAVLIALAASVLPARAAARLDVDQSLSVISYDCTGKDVYVSGSSNQLTLRGTCGALHILGSANNIHGDAFSEISILGSGNIVSYAGKALAVNNVGSANIVTRREAGSSSGSADAAETEESASGSEPIEVTGSGRHAEYDCTKIGSIGVSGSDNVVRLHGVCKNITVSGSGNHVMFDTAARLSVSGAGNVVRWTGAKPAVVDESGTGNSVGAD
jgi:hypothetical protein